MLTKQCDIILFKSLRFAGSVYGCNPGGFSDLLGYSKKYGPGTSVYDPHE